MKYKTFLFGMSSLVVLSGCNMGGSAIDSSGEESEQSITEETSSEEISSVVTSTEVTEPLQSETAMVVFDDLVKETDFSNQHGYQAWLDYLTISEEYVIADFYDANSKGSSSADIDAFFGEEIERAEAAVSENEKMVFYRYPDEAGGMYSEMSDFLAEITFYFANDKLVFTAITPGFYQVTPAEALELDVLTNIFTVEELIEYNPQVFTLAEMNINGIPLRQAMVPAQPSADQSDVVLNAFYMFVVDEDVIHHATIPFTEVSQDFPTGSVMLYNSYFRWLNEQ